MPRYSYGDDLKERVWNLLEALLSQVNAELEGGAAVEGVLLKPSWHKGHSDRPTLEVKAQLADLSKLSKQSKYKLSIDDVRDALRHYLPDFLEILKDKRQIKQGRGSENWHFILTLWSTELQENQKQFYAVWEREKSRETKVRVISPAGLADDNWHNICRAMLAKQKRLTTNELLSADEDMKFELDDIHVPLALVQRTKPDKRGGDVSPEEGSRLLQPTYEEKQRFRHEEFLTQVLQEGKGQSKGRRIAVIGEPGAGKTTLLQSIAFWLLEDKNKNLGLPIWISLADLQGKTLEEYLLQRWLKNALEVVRVTPEQENTLVELFKNNRVWLFLDGVDEIAGDSVGVGARHVVPLQMVASQLEGWVAKARVVLSCRLNVWEANINALGDDFETYRLLDFDYPLQVKEFICRWFRKTDADKGERLWTELDKSERQRIQDLVKNPLRLALLCSTWQSSDKGLPSTKAGLYQRFVEVFYTWKKNRFRTTFEQRQELNAGLGHLALRAIDSEVSRFRLRHKVVCEVLGDPEQEGSLFGLALQLGWLNKVGLAAESETEEKVYAFYHLTFQEYFAALAIDNWKDFLNHVPHNPAQGIYRIFEPQWKEVILLWLGRPHEEVAKEQKEEFIKALVGFEDRCKSFYWYRAYFIAAAGIAEFKDCSIAEADKIVAQIVKWGFGVFDDNRQTLSRYLDPIPWLAQEALLETDSNRVIKTIAENQVSLISNKSKDSSDLQSIGIKSAKILASIGSDSSEAINALLQLINNNSNFVLVSSEAAKSLVKIGKANKEAIISLTRLLQTVQDKQVKITVAWTLGKIESGNSFAINCLTELMNHSQSQEIRLQAACCLLGIYDNHSLAISTLEELSNSQNKNISWQASTVLEKGTVVTYEYNEPEDYSPEEISVAQEAWNNSNSVFELLREDKPELARREAICLILESADCNYTETIAALVEQLDICKDTSSLQLIIEILGKVAVGDKNVVQHLIRFMQTHRPVLAETPRALSKILQDDLFSLAVVGLKDYLQNEDYKSNPFNYEQIHQVIWYCARKMNYPAFHRAWHPQEEVVKTTTAHNQSLNQADLPQSLQSAIANDPQLSQIIHLICIDGSQFIEPDRPAAEIYDQMLDQNCPECDRVPETMPALKLYWNSLKRKSDKRVVLVFYVSSTDTISAKDTALPCPYSETFLSDLSKFGDRICVVTNQPFDHIPLKFFTPSHAIEDVKEWIRTI